MRTAYFLSGPGGDLFCLDRRATPEHGTVLLVPPFAEELNKSRRMLALAGEALMAAGFSVILADLHGTGDSAGDFGDARWQTWLADLDSVATHLAEQGRSLTGLLSVRSGSLLAQDWLGRGPRPLDCWVAWQPVVNGDQFLTQFLRLRSMAAKFAGQDEPVKVLKERLAAGEALEIAGYRLASELATSLGMAHAGKLPVPPVNALHLLEIAAEAGAPSLPVAQLAETWRGAGRNVRAEVLAGESFWASNEIAEVPALVAATVAAFQGARS